MLAAGGGGVRVYRCSLYTASSPVTSGPSSSLTAPSASRARQFATLSWAASSRHLPSFK